MKVRTITAGVTVSKPIKETLIQNVANFVRYVKNSFEEKNISIIFKNINDSLVNVFSYENNSWYSYSPFKTNEKNSLKIMKPGLGYLINVNNNITTIFNGDLFE